MNTDDDFRIYMIDNMKYWSDKLLACNKINDKNFSFVAENVLDELINVFVSYEKINNLGENVVVDLSVDSVLANKLLNE